MTKNNDTIVRLMRTKSDDRDKEWLLEALQAAIELEHATLPPYFCGYWSIKETKDDYAAEQILHVCFEEMIHMSLACNMLAAIGGFPVCSGPDFIPDFGPNCTLPGGVRPDLKITLQSLDQGYLETVYMEIEKPDWDPIASKSEETYDSIGAFYQAVREAFESLFDQGAITISTGRQLSYSLGEVSFSKLADLNEVLAAIDLITEQGEGTPLSPEDEKAELAHYYRFAEVLNGKRLVFEDGKWSYTGDEIRFPDCYTAAAFPEDGGTASEDFDKKYSVMLDNLEKAWAEVDSNLLTTAWQDMTALGDKAIELMTSLTGDTNTDLDGYCPAFKYIS